MLFTFPSRYCSSIGRLQYLALDHGRPCFNRNSTCSGLLGTRLREPYSLRLRGCHLLWRALPIRFGCACGLSLAGAAAAAPRTLPLPRLDNDRSLGIESVWAVPCSLTTTGGISSISSPRVTEMFHFTRFLPLQEGVQPALDGLPHSEISGSMTACVSPELFAACRVLRRLQAPRHPPCALDTFVSVSSSFCIRLSSCAGFRFIGAAEILGSVAWFRFFCFSPHSGLLRKEVIQPHLPVRLPCYDFTPLTGHTLDGSSPEVRPPASGAPDSGGVTGGVYKARERIHRGLADPRLLAIPAS